MAAPVASVFSSAVPMEPPTCWLVLTIAEATPASRTATPYVARFITVAKTMPRPRPRKSRLGSTWVTYPLVRSRPVIHTMAAAAMPMPSGTIGFAPNRGTSTLVVVIDVAIIRATIGMNARPVATGE